MRTIELTQGKVALVDDDVYEWAGKVKWQARVRKRGGYYAARTTYISGKPTTVYLHRMIMGLKHGDKQQVDHRNGDSLDNLTKNLRTCSNTQNNQAYKRVKMGGSSTFRGVSGGKSKRRWEAKIRVKGHNITIGRFLIEIEAAKARDAYARKFNWPEEGMNFPLDTAP
jgi:hypothetical protein